MVMGFSVNLNFDFSGPDMGKAVDDANRAGKASLESNQTTISQTQQTTSANTFHRQNGSSVETVDLSSEVTDASKSKGFETKTGNNNTTLGKANTTANPMGTSSTKATGQSSQTGSNMNMQANGMGSRNMTGSSKENTGMGTLGESKQASIGNKGNDTKQTGMNLNTDSNKGINIKGEDFSKSDTKSLGSNKETNLDIKTGNNNQTGMNGNMSASGNGKNNGQSLGISEMDIETLGDEPVEATMKNTSVGKSQTVNTDKGGFKSIHSETVQVNEKDMEDTGGFLGGVVSFFTGLAEDVGDAVSGWAEDVSAWWNEEAAPVLQDISSTIGDFFIDTGAALVTGVISIGEGILSFGEAIVDTGAIVLTASVSVGTGIVDLGQALYGLVTGEEWESVTKQMWEGTQGFVATEHVKSWFDGFYENTEVGRFLKENANLFGLVDFDTIRSVGSGIGYTIGVVALTVLTFGVGGAAVSGSSATVSAAQLATTAGVAGFGRGTESAWKDGASLGEGLMFGGLNGVWEGFQFYIGGKIAGFGNAGNTFLGHSMKGFENKALNALTRVILDGADGGLEGFAQPLMATVYKDGYTTPEGEYVEFTSDMNIIERAGKLFDSYGGWGNVATQAFIGSAMSVVGEGFDLRRYLKEGQEAKVDSGLIDESKVEMPEEALESSDILEDNLEMNAEMKADIEIDKHNWSNETLETEPNSYYKILVEIDGEEVWLEKDTLYGPIRPEEILSQYQTAGSEVNFKIKEIVKDNIKSNLVITKEQGLVEGMNKCKLIVDGKPTTILFKSPTEMEFNLNNMISPKKSVEFVSIEKMPSYNQKVARTEEIAEDIYEMVYVADGETKTTYLSVDAPPIAFIKPVINIDKFIVDNQIIDFKLESIKKLEKPEIKAKINEQAKYRHMSDFFSKEKYGGNQSDVSDIINGVFEKAVKGEELTVQERIKMFYLGNVAKKYFKDLNDVDLINLADKYASSGCFYMALANAFSTHVLKNPDGASWFRNTIGFDVGYIMNDGKKYYNTDVLAWDMFLNYWSKKYNGNIKSVIENSSGAYLSMVDDLINTYFDDKGIYVKCNMDSSVYFEKPYFHLLNHMLHNSNQNSYNILVAGDFDLEVSQGLKNQKEITDAALDNAEISGVVLKDIGAHAMLITDTADDGNLIVSSWSKKCKFLSDSVEPAKSNGRKPFANIWTIEFIPKDSVEVTPLEEKNILDPFRIMNSDMNSPQVNEVLNANENIQLRSVDSKVMKNGINGTDEIHQLTVPPFIISKKIPVALDTFLKNIYGSYSELEEKFRISIRGVSEECVPETRIPLQLLVTTDGKGYYLNSRIVPTAAKVDSALKHISELVQGTFTVSKLVPNIDRIKLLLGDNIRIPEKIPELQKMIRQELENSRNITDANQLTKLLDECFDRQLQPNTKGIRKNMISAGLKSEFDILEQYGLTNLPSDILTNIQGYAGLSLYLNGLQKYARKDLIFPSAELATKDLMGIPTWVDAGLGDKPYYIEVITRKPQTGELGDEVAFHLVHKSARKELVDMPSSASKQGKKLLLDILVDTANSQNRRSYYHQFFEDILPTTGLEFDSLSQSGKSEMMSQFLKKAQDLAIKRIDEGSTRIYDTEFHDLAERAIIDCIQSPETQQVIQNLIQASYHPETLNMEDIIKELRRRGKE